MSEKLKGQLKSTLQILWSTISLIIGIVIIYSLMNTYILKDVETISWTDDMAPTILEARHPFGSWFNKDEITIRHTGLVIHKHSFWGDETINLPYLKVKKIIISDGAFGTSVKIIRENGFLGKTESINIKEEINKIWLLGYLKIYMPSSEIIERTTFSKKVADIFKKILLMSHRLRN